MNTNCWFTVICLLVASMLTTGCGLSEKVQAIQSESVIRDMPLSPRLYLSSENTLSPNPHNSIGFQNHYLNGGTRSLEWAMQLHNEVLGNHYTYNLVMKSTGRSNATVELILRQGTQETVLGIDTFVIDSTQYLDYRGQFSGTNVAPTNSDQVILRLTVSGDDFGILYGGVKSSIGILAEPDIPSAVVKERTKALVWVANNTICRDEELSTCDLFNDFRDRLDPTIISGDSAKWLFGWGLTISGKPYSLEWTNEAFSVEEISMDEAQQAGVKEMQIMFELNP